VILFVEPKTPNLYMGKPFMETIRGLDHIQIAMPAGEEAASRAFYRDLLGLEEIAKPEPLAARGG
jgi:hypothetical protein